MLIMFEGIFYDIYQIIIVIGISALYIKYVMKSNCRGAYLLAYSIRLLLLFISVYGRKYVVLPFDGGDTEYFYGAATEGVTHVSFGYDTFVTITALASYFLGDARLIYQYIMLMISMLGVKLTDKSMQELGISRDIRRKCLLIIAVFPTFACLNIIYAKEAIIFTFIIASIFLYIRSVKTANSEALSNVWLLLSLIIAVIGCFFHAACVSAVFGIVMAVLFYNPKTDRFKLSKRTLIAGLLFIVSLCTIYRFLPWKFGSDFKIADLARRFMYDSNLDAGSTYAQYVGDSDTWGRFLLYTPARMFYAMFSPLPWQWRGTADIGVFLLNSVFYIAVSVTALINCFRKNYWKNINKWLVLTAMIASAIVGWGCTAFGTSIRHRDEFFPLFAILLALELRGRDKADIFIEDKTEKTV